MRRWSAAGARARGTPRAFSVDSYFWNGLSVGSIVEVCITRGALGLDYASSIKRELITVRSSDGAIASRGDRPRRAVRITVTATSPYAAVRLYQEKNANRHGFTHSPPRSGQR